MLTAPTGMGKTLALWLPGQSLPPPSMEKQGPRLLWLTPMRSLARDTTRALIESQLDGQAPWRVGCWIGDTSAAERARYRKNWPEALVTTPESLHLFLSRSDHPEFFGGLQTVVVDEWHELLGSKRGVLVELALVRLRSLCPGLRVWGISATLGNPAEAAECLCPATHPTDRPLVIAAPPGKVIELTTIHPQKNHQMPWAGHLGLHLLPELIPYLTRAGSTLLFTNTRSQAEIWYRELVAHLGRQGSSQGDQIRPEEVALHHGSLDQAERTAVEDGVHEGRLRVVVCTSSLDLGVDFQPVELVVQVGSPKGVARLRQRAGRSGHRPGAVSQVLYVPTHALEYLEGPALRQALAEDKCESRSPLPNRLDVLSQYLVTLAAGTGFAATKLYPEVRTTLAYRNLSREDWEAVLRFITTGGNSLERYPQFRRVECLDGDHYRLRDERAVLRHRLSIGTIASAASLSVKPRRGPAYGHVEESFITRLKPGETFYFAGKHLALIGIRGDAALVRPATGKGGTTPQWMGGKMPLSSTLSAEIRAVLGGGPTALEKHPEGKTLQPILELQKKLSHLPAAEELLIESIESREGYHLFVYPFAGRLTHEGMAALFAWRLAKDTPRTFSLAMNDYGFELLAAEPFPTDEGTIRSLIRTDHLEQTILASLNASEMARRQFHEIARVAGLVFSGYPGKPRKMKEMQISPQLLFDVFQRYDNQHLLFRQAYTEVLEQRLDHRRMGSVLEELQQRPIKLTRPSRPTPFAFPIMVDRLRAQLSSETLEARIERLQRQVVG